MRVKSAGITLREKSVSPSKVPEDVMGLLVVFWSALMFCRRA